MTKDLSLDISCFCTSGNGLGSDVGVASSSWPQPSYYSLLSHHQLRIPHSFAACCTQSPPAQQFTLPALPNPANYPRNRTATPPMLIRTPVALPHPNHTTSLSLSGGNVPHLQYVPSKSISRRQQVTHGKLWEHKVGAGDSKLHRCPVFALRKQRLQLVCSQVNK